MPTGWKSVRENRLGGCRRCGLLGLVATLVLSFVASAGIGLAGPVVAAVPREVHLHSLDGSLHRVGVRAGATANGTGAGRRGVAAAAPRRISPKAAAPFAVGAANATCTESEASVSVLNTSASPQTISFGDGIDSFDFELMAGEEFDFYWPLRFAESTEWHIAYQGVEFARGVVSRPSAADCLGQCVHAEACPYHFGGPGDLAVPADFDGNRTVDLAVFRNGVWYIDTDRDGNADRSIAFGAPGDRAYAADYDGDGIADLIIFRGAIGTWFIDTNLDGNADVVVHYASPGDLPYIGDFNDDGRIDLGIFRPSEGNWYVDTNGDGFGDIVEHYASPGDVPAPADYDADGRLDYAIFRPSNGCYFINDGHFHLGTSPGPSGAPLANGFATTTIGFASPGDQMAAGDYNGSGDTQLAIFRPSTGTWWIRNAGWNSPRGDEGRVCN